jgi:competence protein ComEA
VRHRWLAARAKLATFARALAANRWAAPALRVVALGGGLALLALIGVAAASPSTTSATGAASVFAPIPSLSADPASTPPQLPTTASPPPPTTSPAVPPSEEPVILNLATAEELQRLPGIGPKKAQAILALRQRMGRFRQIEDLMKVKGIGRATVKRLRPKVRIDPPPQPAPSASPGQAEQTDASTT